MRYLINNAPEAVFVPGGDRTKIEFPASVAEVMGKPKSCARSETGPHPFRWFDSSPEVIRLVVMMYARDPLSLRNVEELLFERGIDVCH